ncbi:MAG: DUF3667 domain-containing protein [Burkholderiaceae bacterium]|nr:DUF3667 domain-containing protein [Burkholderiaceae bacterium]
MLNEIEAGGDLATATLAAAAIEGNSGRGAMDAHQEKACLNCGAALVGNYCHVCGQSGHLHRSLLHLVEELLHGLFHFEAKGWRTLPQLVAFPGRLTRSYIDGKRTRYVSPLALFLFMVFLMFFVASFSETPRLSADAAERQQIHAEMLRDIEESKQQVAAAEQALAAAMQNGKNLDEAKTELASARNGQRVLELALLGTDKLVSTADDAKTDTKSDDLMRSLSKLPVATGNSVFDKALRHALENPELTLYKLKNSAYKLSFMLIPISLPFLWLMFLGKKGIGMYDHAVFSLYSLSFMSLLFIAVLLCAYAGLSAPIAPLILCVPPLHMFLQLRGTYGLSVPSALWRTATLLVVAGTVFLLFLLLIVAVTMH